MSDKRYFGKRVNLAPLARHRTDALEFSVYMF